MTAVTLSGPGSVNIVNGNLDGVSNNATVNLILPVQNVSGMSVLTGTNTNTGTYNAESGVTVELASQTLTSGSFTGAGLFSAATFQTEALSGVTFTDTNLGGSGTVNLSGSNTITNLNNGVTGTGGTYATSTLKN